MKLTVKQLKRLIKEQLEEMGTTAGFTENDEQEDDPTMGDPSGRRNRKAIQLYKLEQELKHFDWYYMMSDDSHVYMTGSRQLSVLREKARKLGIEGERLLKKYADENQMSHVLEENFNEEQSVPDAPPVPIHEQGTNACSVITQKDMRSGETSLEEETEEGCHESLENGEQQELDFGSTEKEKLRKLEKAFGRYINDYGDDDEPCDALLDSLKSRARELGPKGIELYNVYFNDDGSSRIEEGYTGSPTDGGGITGTQATSGAADVVKEEFNKRASKGLKDLKKDFDASTLLPPSKWHKCKICRYTETNRPNGICRRCATNGNRAIEEQCAFLKKKIKK